MLRLEEKGISRHTEKGNDMSSRLAVPLDIIRRAQGEGCENNYRSSQAGRGQDHPRLHFCLSIFHRGGSDVGFCFWAKLLGLVF